MPVWVSVGTSLIHGSASSDACFLARRSRKNERVQGLTFDTASLTTSSADPRGVV